MKKFILLAVIISAAFAFVLSANAEGAKRYGTVVTADVNLRSAPNTNCEILDVIPLYGGFEILSLKDGWYHIVYEEKTGYIRSDYVFEITSGTRSAYVINDNTLMYGMPSESSYKADTLSAGQAVKVKTITGDWFYIAYGDSYGYVKAKDLTVSKPGSSSLDVLLTVGMQGEEVKKLQQKLCDRGFLSLANITGYYGTATKKAVAEFQDICGMDSDGIAGDETVAALYDPHNTVTHETAQYNRVKGTVVLLDWFKGGSDWLHKGAYFTITDVDTGLSFRARRFGGWYHADSEPVTAADTAIMKKIAGGRWSWDRHAVWVTYHGKTVAASIHCMPHMANPTSSNNFDGHFCVHLLHSKVHANSKECPRHQACVMKAYRKGRAQ